MDDKRSVRKQIRRDANRRSILEAAEKVFGEKGYASATMDDIAAEAQFSKATLYRYFEGKSEVFTEIIRSSLWGVREGFKEIRGRKSSAESRLREMVRLTLSYSRRKRSLARIFWVERSAVKRILGLDIEHHCFGEDKRLGIPDDFIKIADEVFDYLLDVIQEGMKNGEFREVDPQKACAVLGALMRGLQVHSPFLKENQYLDERTDILMEFFLNGIRNREFSQEGDPI
jgi:AcrR family transcriptional regulator